MIKVIGFDLDDTLWAVKPVILRAEQVLSDWLKAQVPALAYDMQTMRSLRFELIEQQPELAQKITLLRRRILERAMVNSGITSNQADLLAGQAIEVFLTARNEIVFFEGALDAIATLSGRFTLGALTNGNADIRRIGLDKHFSFSFSAEQVGAPKPAPTLFEHALAHAKVAPHEMVYVGDDPHLDIDAANAAGLRTIWMRGTEKPDAGHTAPDVTITHANELVQAVLKLAD